ncbi:unnamed protein product [Cyprideis torosa]|uniref:Uncharacterized protein n=1 Tax=Cyprideis torosa TaxID=163714 RepID=A0A7R8WJU7_9CRUS|nr:unnamed protein product [Cyprideis torosa]CAG0896384.1 unnamed protein product [Cyprideis torosa]
MKSTLLFVLVACVSSASIKGQGRGSSPLGENMFLNWMVDGEMITMTLTGPDGGWIGVGTSEDGHMLYSDLFVGWVRNGDVVGMDMHVGMDGPPMLDHEQNGEILDFTSDGTTQTITFRRALDTGDTSEHGDRPIELAPMNVLWAWGPIGVDGMPDYHGPDGQRGHLVIDFSQ